MSMIEIPDYLQNLKKVFQDHQEMLDYYEWIIQSGKSFDGHNRNRVKEADLIDEGMPYTKSQCFHNSQLIVVDNPDIYYYEGWYVTDKFPTPIEHGFNVFNGKVVDLTTHNLDGKVFEYLGIHIPTKFIRNRMVKSGIAETILWIYYMKKRKDNGNGRGI